MSNAIPTEPQCNVPDCDRTAEVRGCCRSHYQSLREQIRRGRLTDAELVAQGVFDLAYEDKSRGVRARPEIAGIIQRAEQARKLNIPGSPDRSKYPISRREAGQQQTH